MFEPERVVSGMNAILAEELATRRLRKQNLMLLAKRERAPGPAIRLIVKPVMLITARRVRVDLRDRRRGESTDTVTIRSRRDELARTQQQLARFLVTSGEMMKERLTRERVRGFERMRHRIEHPQSLAQILIAARIARRHQRSSSLTL